MKKLRIAVDTSVISEVKEDSPNKCETIEFFMKCLRYKNKIDVFVPPTVLQELKDAPPEVWEYLEKLEDLECLKIRKGLKLLNKRWKMREKIMKHILNEKERKKKSLKSSDLKIIIDSAILKCHFLISYNIEDFRKKEKREFIEKTLKKHKLTVPKIMTPKEFIKFLEKLNLK